LLRVFGLGDIARKHPALEDLGIGDLPLVVNDLISELPERRTTLEFLLKWMKEEEN